MREHDAGGAPAGDGAAARRADHDRTLAAIHDVEEALGSAAPGREPHWRRRVIDRLETLEALIRK